jgi:uncharacterized membrane protein
MLGFFTRATYDPATLAGPVIVTIIDLIRGTFLCGAVAWESYLLSYKFT